VNPDFPYTPESSGDPVRYANYPPTAPADRPLPEETSRLGSDTTPESHRAHHWMHLLMCAPMLLVVGYLVLTGRAGGGSIFYAVGCMVMMGVMMAMMNHGSSTDDSATNTPGHRH
jgi:hypothetical protein